MEADLKTLLANVRPEEATLDAVVIHEGSRILHGDTIPIPDGVESFEYLEIYGSFKSSAGDAYGLPLAKVTPELLLDTYYGDFTMSSRYVSSSDYAYVRTSAAVNTSTSIAIFADSSVNWLEVGVDKVVGYKRRYSKTSLAEITEAASKPNLFINTWHASPKVRNQRGFDGNWSALAIGDYGLDMWLKTSATHKGFIVEAGSYKPSAKHTVVADYGAILGTVISPADGGHWLHAFPFASDKFSIREGELPLGWSPETDSRLDECLTSYEVVSVRVEGMVHGPNGELRTPFFKFSHKKRITPTTPNGSTLTLNILAFSSAGNGINLPCTASTLVVNEQGFYYTSLGNYESVAASVNASAENFQISDNTINYPVFDAAIALTDVTDDAEHRVVWGV